MTRFIGFLTLAMIACGGGSGGGTGNWDDEVAQLAATGCALGATCFGDTEKEMCEADVVADMADARAQLDDTGELQCIECMNVKSVEMQKILDADCDIRAASEAAVFAACDLDPAVDFDGDGTVDNDDDEACAGFP